MERDLLLVLVDKRKEAAPTVQKILTGWGCIIKTRLGIHDGILDKCTDTGLLVLELAGDKEQNKELAHKLDILTGVTAKLVELAV